MPIEQLRALATYYREIIASLSYQSGRHLIDLGANLRYGLTVDLGPYVPRPSVLIEQDGLSFRVERVSPEAVSEVVELAGRVEETADETRSETSPSITPDDERNARSALTARLIAIYRKQQQDPYNRETILGYPLVAGRYGTTRFCAPLLYFPVEIQYDPVKSTFSITKQFETPTLNSHLLVKLTGSEDEATAVRRDLLPLLHQGEFDQDSLEKMIRILAELSPGLKGLKRDPRESAPLVDALETRNNIESILFKIAVLVNAKRTGAFLQDDLAELGNLEELHGETVVDTLLADVAENVEEPSDPDVEGASNPLLFPLQSNKAQRVTARKAERAKLLVVQGPPGTGKSQTITNLVCHLTASGHSVLVTSHQNKALEVITQMLPHIDYLAMSLLKGEKESVTQLANQLDRFSSAVEGKTLKGLEEARARSLSKLLENEAQIGRLTVRFAELKILERDRTSPYQRYHDIRDYDCIHPNDQIPLNSDQTIVESLTKWRQRLGEVQPHLPELIKVFGDQGTDPKTVTDSYSSLQALIRVFRETAQLISDKRGLLDLVREITKEEALSSADRKCLADWSAWLGKTKATILSSLGLLQTLETEPVSLEKTLHLARSLGPRTVQNILQEAERASENASRMLENWPPSQDLPTRPTEEQLASAQEAINNLYARSDSWFSWQLSPSSH